MAAPTQRDVADEPTWFDEIDLGAPWRRMGTRRIDGEAAAPEAEQLAERRRLWAERPADLFAVAEGHEAVVHTVSEQLSSLRPGDASPPEDLHPLAAAGLAGVEDLCLLQRRPTAQGEARWHLDAAFLAFPSRWRLADKIGRPMELVHTPVEGYGVHLAERVHGLLDALAAGEADQRDVRGRRNWFVHPDGSLFQPSRPPGGDPIVAAEDLDDGLWLRSEAQTLRAFAPGWVLFTIRIQQATLGRFLADPVRRAAFAAWLADASDDVVSHHGIGPEQGAVLRDALGAAPGAESP